MNTNIKEKPILTQDDISKLVYQCSNQEQVQKLVRELKQADMQDCPPSSILALYVIQDLYSEDSTDNANINRITTNLEALAEDLYTTSRFIKALKPS